jgi:hypothetical protein
MDGRQTSLSFIRLKLPAIRGGRVKTRATGFAVLREARTIERAWIFAAGEKSERGASERIFLAGENPRVLTRVTQTARPSIECERYGRAESPADLFFSFE